MNLFARMLVGAVARSVVGLAFRRLFGKVSVYSKPRIEESMLEKYGLICTAPQGIVMFFQLAHKTDRDEKPYTWAMVEHSLDNSCAFLWMIYTPEEMRRKGYAKDLIAVLRERFAEIRTHYNDGIINSAGCQLMLNCGFKPIRSLKKREPGMLVWRKK